MVQTKQLAATALVCAALAACAPGPAGGTAETGPSTMAVRASRSDSATSTATTSASAKVPAAEAAYRIDFQLRMERQLDSLDGDLTAMESDVRRGATEARIATVADLRQVHRFLTASLARAPNTSADDWPRFAIGFVTTLRALRRGLDEARVMDQFSETHRTADS